MQTCVIWRRDGKLPWIQFAECGLQLRIFSRKRVVRFGSHLGGGVRHNKAGYLVRDDQQHLTPSVPTVVAPPPESISH